PTGAALVCSSAIFLLSFFLGLRSRRRLRMQLALPQRTQHARAVLFQLPQLLETVGLSHGQLEPQPEHLLARVIGLPRQLLGIDLSDFVDFHVRFPTSPRSPFRGRSSWSESAASALRAAS